MNNKADTAPWIDGTYRSPEQYRGFKLSSQYLTMRDRVKIAIDIYLPRKLYPGSRIPTVLYQTRYYRRIIYTWFARPFIKKIDRTRQEFERLVQNGYAVVCVDVRGTGSSFCSRHMEFSPDEVKDSAEIADWIVAQPWSNGVIGTLGTSYTGTTAELALTNHHPAIKAAVIRYAQFDAYTDIVCPGGVRNSGFMKTWSRFNHALDTDYLKEFASRNISPLAGIALQGMAPVDDDVDRKLLSEAVQQHQDNYDIYETSKEVVFRDDTSESGISLDQISTCTRADQIHASNVPIYNWSSWFDGGFTLSAVKRFLSITNPGSRLILGPWDHGGRMNPDPHSGDFKTYFDHTGEVLRFFDHYLKGHATGIEADPLVRYFTMAEESWKSADSWPPPGYLHNPLYIHRGRRLVIDQPPEQSGSDPYQIDYSTSSGTASRWVSLINVKQVNIAYPDRNEQDVKLLVYQTEPIGRDMEVTGHPLVTLYIRSQSDDVQIFVYLEDVTPNGKILYVTEGQFRAIHRKISPEQPANHLPIPNHTYRREDALPLVPGEAAELIFDLLPVSYLFRSGHSIRLAIAGADRENFANLPIEPPQIEILWGPKHPSCIQLPAR